MKKYAKVVWTANDIFSLKPEWTDEQAEEWLECNQKYIQDRLVEVGWEVIESLLPSDSGEADD